MGTLPTMLTSLGHNLNGHFHSTSDVHLVWVMGLSVVLHIKA